MSEGWGLSSRELEPGASSPRPKPAADGYRWEGATAWQTHGIPPDASTLGATAWQTQGNRMANAWQSHGKRTAIAWPTHGIPPDASTLGATAWQPHGNRMANAWQPHGKRMAIAWRTRPRQHLVSACRPLVDASRPLSKPRNA